IKDLGLDQQVISVSKSHPSAKKRYIEYNQEINKLPSSLKDILFENPPIMDSVIGSIISEPFQPSKTYSNDHDDDESIYSFIERRFNQHVALNLVGAITHGIYAGDCKSLSVQATFPFLPAYEKKFGSIVKGLISDDLQLDTAQELRIAKECQAKDPTWHQTLQGASVIGLLPGLEALPKKLFQYLDQHPNVDILLNQKVTQLSIPIYNKNVTHASSPSLKDDMITVSTNHDQQQGQQDHFKSNHIISTLPAKALHELIPSLPHLDYNPNVNVAVVNVAYPKKAIDFKLDGFGFLTPHRDSLMRLSTKVPGLLGVIFDSNSMGEQDQDYIRFTAMIGGSDWDLAFGDDHLPSTLTSHALSLTKKIMSDYLSIHNNKGHVEPSYYQVNILQECLPQYLVGHPKRMTDLHHAIQDQMGHQLSVTGASYLGVSVGDCIKNSRVLVDNLVSSGTLGNRSTFITGLEKSLHSI
ncbi:hypothetical protein BJ944DRAFT_274177, partial [Cunninghamella echinulata]